MIGEKSLISDRERRSLDEMREKLKLWEADPNPENNPFREFSKGSTGKVDLTMTREDRELAPDQVRELEKKWTSGDPTDLGNGVHGGRVTKLGVKPADPVIARKPWPELSLWEKTTGVLLQPAGPVDHCSFCGVEGDTQSLATGKRMTGLREEVEETVIRGITVRTVRMVPKVERKKACKRCISNLQVHKKNPDTGKDETSYEGVQFPSWS